jgi:hypothetical protein
MISRRTARVLAEVYASQFTYRKRSRGYGSDYDAIWHDQLYDFLFDLDYSAWFCNATKHIPSNARKFKEFFMQLHTGETLTSVTQSWSWEQRERLGQEYLRNLGRDFLNADFKALYGDPELKEIKQALLKSYELDGYEFKDSRLLAPETDLLDAKEEAGVLISLYEKLSLANFEGHHADAYFGLRESLEALFGRSVDLVMTRAIRHPYFLEAIEPTRTLLYAA